MINTPKTIYLQIGEGDVNDFNKLAEVTWCEDKINDNDIEFRVYTKSEALEALKDLVERVDINDGLGEYKGGSPFIMVRAREIIAKEKS